MADGLDYLPPGTTYADIDALCESRELTDDELRVAALEEPDRFGLCVSCARDAGVEIKAIPGLDRCATCLAHGPEDHQAVEDLLRRIADEGVRDTDRVDILTLVWPLVDLRRVWRRVS